MGNLLTRIQLLSKTNENTKNYGFKGVDFIAKVVSVYDGDTFRAIVKIHGEFHVIRVRCYGYDSPELKPSAQCSDKDAEIVKAEAARDALAKLILNKIVTLHIHDFDKFGRFLATVYVRKFIVVKQNVNKIMLENGYGYEYYGGKKRVEANNGV